MKLIVLTIVSKLALERTNWVIDKLKEHYPKIEFETKSIKQKEI